MTRVLRGLAGLLVGIVAGSVLMLSVVVFRRVVEGVYLHGIGDLLGWVALPAVVLPLLGLWAALSPRMPHFWTVVAGNVAGIAAGAVLGAAFGGSVGERPTAPWSGGLLGAGVGMITLTVACGVLASRDPEQIRGPRTGAAAVLGASAIVALLFGGSIFSDPAPDPAGEGMAEPAPDAVESVIFLVGDPGGSPDARYPVLERAGTDLDRWAAALSRDSSVIALVLGDVIYPDGLHAPDDPTREEDSLTVLSQIDLVRGTNARQHRARAIFLPGNHDWGRREDWEGAVRIHRLQDFLASWEEARGVPLRLAPPAGTGGPDVVDVGSHLRLVLLDTAWWLLEGDRAAKARVVDGVEDALRTAGDREVVIAAHHPFASGGPHGHARGFGRTFGFGFLLTRAGAMLQDLSSRPYEDLRRHLERIFRREGAPALFVGGHEHSLQVFRGSDPGHPRLSAVVGSAVKLTGLEGASDMVAGLSAPGYARLFVLKDGSLRLLLEATEPRYLRCPDERSPCLEQALDSFRTVWAGEPPPPPPAGVN